MRLPSASASVVALTSPLTPTARGSPARTESESIDPTTRAGTKTDDRRTPLVALGICEPCFTLRPDETERRDRSSDQVLVRPDAIERLVPFAQERGIPTGGDENASLDHTAIDSDGARPERTDVDGPLDGGPTQRCSIDLPGKSHFDDVSNRRHDVDGLGVTRVHSTALLARVLHEERNAGDVGDATALDIPEVPSWLEARTVVGRDDEEGAVVEPGALQPLHDTAEQAIRVSDLELVSLQSLIDENL